MDNILLDFELVPEQTWYFNLRYFLLDSEWNNIKKCIKKRALDTCEICGRKCLLHSHETWEYDDITHIQKLKSIRGLCEDCHRVKHIGFAGVEGKLNEAREWYCKINNLNIEEELINEQKAFDEWEIRNLSRWRIEIDRDIIKEILGRYPIFVGENVNGRYYLNTQYKDKDEVKSLGALWDKNIRAWYFTDIKDFPKFKKWLIL